MCLFCDIYINPRLNINVEDQILFETNNFYVKPALGQFVEGYVLINTKEHVQNYSFLKSKKVYAELQQLIVNQTNILKSLYDFDIMIFEHGSLNNACSNVCNVKCIDHAHFHILPMKKSISNLIEKDFDSQSLNSIDELSKFKKTPYLYYEFRDEKKVYVIDKLIQSQYLRKIICQEIEMNNKWNWKFNPYRDKIESFVMKYEEFQFKSLSCKLPL